MTGALSVPAVVGHVQRHALGPLNRNRQAVPHYSLGLKAGR
jgi:hypothetical protein